MNKAPNRLYLPAIVLTLFFLPLSFSPSHKNSLHLLGTSVYAEDGSDDGGEGDDDGGGPWEEEDNSYDGEPCGGGNPGLDGNSNYVLKSKMCVKGTTISYTQGPNGPVASVTIIWGRKAKCFPKNDKNCAENKEHECQ